MAADAENNEVVHPATFRPVTRVGFWLIRSLARCLLKIYCRAQYKGRKNVPASGPLIVASNHAGWLDVLFLGAAIPRPIHYLVARQYYDKWYLRWIMYLYRAIPVERGKGGREPLRQALQTLKRGRVLGVFPEGHMSPDGKPKPFEGGVALFASEADAPILPVVIVGSYEIMGRRHKFPRPRKLRVRIGNPLRPRGLTRTEILERLRHEMERLMESTEPPM